MKTLEENKQEMKTAVSEEIDRYYEEFARASADQTCKIGGFERIAMEHKRRLDEILRDFTGKALGIIETGDDKKMQMP